MVDLLDALRRRADDDPWLTSQAVVAAATAFVDMLEGSARRPPEWYSPFASPWDEPADLDLRDPYRPWNPYAFDHDEKRDALRHPLRGQTFPEQHGEGAENLVDAARRTPMVARLEALATWVGEGRSVTDTDVLRPGAVAEVCSVLGLPPPSPGLSSAKRHQPLNDVWLIALKTGRVEIRRSSDGRRAVGNRDREGLSDWADAVTCVCSPLNPEFHRASGYRVQETTGEAILAILPELYVSGAAHTQTVVGEVLAATKRSARMGEQVHPVLERWLGLLVDLGVVVRSDYRYDVTPLGRLGLNRVLTDLGADAPWAEAERT